MKPGLFLFFLLFPFFCNGQPYTLKRDVDIDTLQVFIQLPEMADVHMKEELKNRFETAINNFNSRPKKEFRLSQDSAGKGNWLTLRMAPINYVDKKRNLSGVLLNIGIIGGHVLMISKYGWTIPIPPLIPSTVSLTTIEIDPTIISDKKNLRRIGIGSSGFFRSFDKQSQLFKRAFGRDILDYVYKLEQQDKKNRKRRNRK